MFRGINVFSASVAFFAGIAANSFWADSWATNFAGYVDSGVLTANRSGFTPAMFKFYVSTPMIIIDGKKGPLKVGSLPLYQVPKLLLDLLNDKESTILDYSHPLAEMRVRPLPGLHFNVLKDGKIDVCKEPPFSESCQKSTHWLGDVTTVSNDLFIGQQFTRIKHPVNEVEQTELPEKVMVETTGKQIPTLPQKNDRHR